MDTSYLLIADDFNLHMGDEANIGTRRFIDLLIAGEHIEGPTYVAGHTIDLLITRSSDAFLFMLMTRKFISQ